MSNFQVTCATKTNRYDHESITLVGGPAGVWTKQVVANTIESGLHAFYTQAADYVAWLRVRYGRNGKFVQTESDPTPANNLLNLPNC